MKMTRSKRLANCRATSTDILHVPARVLVVGSRGLSEYLPVNQNGSTNRAVPIFCPRRAALLEAGARCCPYLPHEDVDATKYFKRVR